MISMNNLQPYELLTDPLGYILDFCEKDCEIEDFRYEVGNMIKSACSHQKYGDSENYFFNYRCLMQLLESCHSLYNRGLTQKQTTSCLKVNNSLFSKENDGYFKTNYRTLSKKEIQNLNFFFEDFFCFKSFKEWSLTFSQLVEYAYRRHTIDEVLEEGSIAVILSEYIEKLIEAVYLIHHCNREIELHIQ